MKNTCDVCANPVQDPCVCETCSKWVCGRCSDTCLCNIFFCSNCRELHDCLGSKAVELFKETLPTPGAIARRMNVPLKRWPGRCYEIAYFIVRTGIIEGFARYGHYSGYVHPKSIFADRAVVQHGWIETKTGLVVDPTRWVFECVKPYLHVDVYTQDYDIGGNRYRESHRGALPDFNPQQRIFSIGELAEPANSMVRTQIVSRRSVSINQLHWFATMSPTTLGVCAKPLYSWLESIGMRSLVPVDNWQLIMQTTIPKPTPHRRIGRRKILRRDRSVK